VARGAAAWRVGALVLCIVLAGAPAHGGSLPVWDVSQVTRPGQWTLYNRTLFAAVLGFPLAGGDMNGDGRADLVLTPMNADSGPDRDRTSAGEAVIVLSAGSIAGERDLGELDVDALPPDIVVVYGADPFDYLGTQVTAADLDDDGYADAVIGAQYGDGADNSRRDAGEVAIVWGGAALGGSVIDLAAPPAGAVTFVYGAAPGARLGSWVSDGDVDGDGIADAILGADEANPDTRPHAGITYVLYGGTAVRAIAAVDLAAPAVPVTAIAGIDREDHSGATVRATDLNGDGAAEVLIGAGLNRLSSQVGPGGNFDGHGSGGGDGPDNACDPINLRCEIGEAYIVYSEPGMRPASIDLADPPPSTTIIYGIDGGDAYGEELYAGDFNGDGWGDVAVGAITADGPSNMQPTPTPNSRPSAGELALILGGPGLSGSTIHLNDPPPNVTIFYGPRAGAITGDTAMLLDVDGDGLDELVIAGPNDQPAGRVEAGRTFVIFGTADPLPAVVDLAAVPSTLSTLVIEGADPNDMLAYSMGQGDVNGDALPDLILNVMGGDGFLNRVNLAGDAYVLDAVAVTRAVGREPAPTRTVTPTPSTTPSATPTVSRHATPTATPTAFACAGDCDGGGSVTIDEVIDAVRVALGVAPVSTCTAVDRDASGTVEIDELIASVDSSLTGC